MKIEFYAAKGGKSIGIIITFCQKVQTGIDSCNESTYRLLKKNFLKIEKQFFN